ncbi:MAG: D-alanyl-D-alanine carboxypeptidase family protein [Patescibacteria group bacterium]
MSIFFNLIGFSPIVFKLDNAIYKDENGSKNTAAASMIDLSLPEVVIRPQVSKNAPNPNINANHYLLADMDSGTIFTSYDSNTRVPIASTTKIMTAIVVLENYKLDDIVTITPEAAYQIGADAYLQVGEKISVDDLLHCLLIKSGNDSAYALAQHMSKDNSSTADFVSKMNETAARLGMKNTNYLDPAGLDVAGYSSAYDLFLATKYAMRFEKFREIVNTQEYTATNIDNSIYHELKNSNRLVGEYQYPGAIGVKTGYMPEAGHCLVSAAKRDGHTLIGIVLHTYADTAPASADESRKLLDWGFTNIKWFN